MTNLTKAEEQLLIETLGKSFNGVNYLEEIKPRARKAHCVWNNEISIGENIEIFVLVITFNGVRIRVAKTIKNEIVNIYRF